jgi:hypothetical protein
MDEIEAFLDECRADSFFRSHPELVDRLERVLTTFYLGGGRPRVEWEVTWDKVRGILESKTAPLIDRCEALIDFPPGYQTVSVIAEIAPITPSRCTSRGI